MFSDPRNPTIGSANRSFGGQLSRPSSPDTNNLNAIDFSNVPTEVALRAITPAGQGWPLWGSCVENIQESEIGDVRPTSHGSNSLQNGQKYDIMRVLRTSYVMFFSQNQIFI